MTYTYTGIRSPSASRSATKIGVMLIGAGAFMDAACSRLGRSLLGILEIPSDRPSAVVRVRDHGDRHVCARIVNGTERDTRVVPLQEDGVAGRVEPEAKPIAPRVLRGVA